MTCANGETPFPEKGADAILSAFDMLELARQRPIHFMGIDDDGTYHISARAGMRTPSWDEDE